MADQWVVLKVVLTVERKAVVKVVDWVESTELCLAVWLGYSEAAMLVGRLAGKQVAKMAERRASEMVA